MMRLNFGTLLRALREVSPTRNPEDPRSRETITMGEMSRVLGTTVSYVSAVERGDRGARYTEGQLKMFAHLTNTQYELLRECRDNAMMLRLALSLHPRYEDENVQRRRHKLLCALTFGDKERAG